jgi:hypothetical protein
LNFYSKKAHQGFSGDFERTEVSSLLLLQLQGAQVQKKQIDLTSSGPLSTGSTQKRHGSGSLICREWILSVLNRFLVVEPFIPQNMENSSLGIIISFLWLKISHKLNPPTRLR